MRRPLVMWLLLSSRLWLSGRVGSASLRIDVGDKLVHWSSWQPWICMCNLHKQARIRHVVAWAVNVTLGLEDSEFWEERPCALQDCSTCMPEDCPGSLKRSGLTPQSQSFLSANPHDSEISLPLSLDSESYDNLPVVDDMGEE